MIYDPPNHSLIFSLISFYFFHFFLFISYFSNFLSLYYYILFRAFFNILFSLNSLSIYLFINWPIFSIYSFPNNKTWQTWHFQNIKTTHKKPHIPWVHFSPTASLALITYITPPISADIILFFYLFKSLFILCNILIYIYNICI